jgi:hypothetical protein
VVLGGVQLASVKRLLRNAHSLVEDVAAIFHKSGDIETTGRLKTILSFIADEILEVDLKIALADHAEKTQL